MSIQELFEEGDTGEAILPIHADRDGSEAREARLAPRGDNPSTSMPTTRDAGRSLTDAERLNVLETLSEWEMYSALAWLSGYVPEAFDAAVRRHS